MSQGRYSSYFNKVLAQQEEDVTRVKKTKEHEQSKKGKGKDRAEEEKKGKKSKKTEKFFFSDKETKEKEKDKKRKEKEKESALKDKYSSYLNNIFTTEQPTRKDKPKTKQHHGEKALSKENDSSKMNLEDTNVKYKMYIDPSVRSKLVEIPPNAPEWKKVILQRKNQKVIDEAVREAEARKDPYAGVPEWKKPLLHKRDATEKEKQKKREEEMKVREDNMRRFNNHPMWRKELIMDKYYSGSRNIEDVRK